MIQNNRHHYSVSAMCAVLQLPKSTFYYEAKEKDSSEVDDLTLQITEILTQNVSKSSLTQSCQIVE